MPNVVFVGMDFIIAQEKGGEMSIMPLMGIERMR